MTNFVDFGLGMTEQGMEVLEGVSVEYLLGLFVRSGDDVADGAESRRYHFHFLVAEQRHEVGHEAGIDNHLKANI